MGWTKTQKATAAMAWRATGRSDELRKLLLRQFDNAFFNADGEATDEPSSTSSRLGNGDFEHYMAVVETTCGGRINTRGLSYPADHWQSKVAGALHRMRRLVNRLVAALQAADLLSTDEGALAGWIEKYVTEGRPARLADLQFLDLHKLINGLRSYARRNQVQWDERELETASA